MQPEERTAYGQALPAGLPGPWPADWPQPGQPIDPAHHDLPHPGAGIEWWYVNAHAALDSDTECSLFAAFFRVSVTADDGTVDYGHSLLWGISQPGDPLGAPDRYTPEAWLDAGMVSIVERILHRDEATDPQLREAMLRIVSTGRPPLPDRLIPGRVQVAADRLDLRYGEVGEFRRLDDGSYLLRLSGQDSQVETVFRPTKPAVRNGDHGIVPGKTGDPNGMFYYTIPRCELAGSVTVAGATHLITSGSGWYDHEFDSQRMPLGRGREDQDAAWHWLGLQLDNGWDLCVYRLYDINPWSGETAVRQVTAIAVAPDGQLVRLEEYGFEGDQHWQSLQTLNTYPTRWRLTAPRIGLDITLEAAFRHQEVRSITAGQGFWEGRVSGTGQMAGVPVRGVGFVELRESETITDVSDYFGRIADSTRDEVRRWYPDRADDQTLRGLLGVDTRHPLDGVDPEQLHAGLIAPVRYISELGGKSWRSYLILAVLELFGTGSDPYRPLLAATEVFHGGSLIIDDVEDNATLRRGAPATQHAFGTATAINAGTAAYFAFDRILRQVLPADPVLRVAVYETYLGTLRAAHAGQAIDINGHAAALEQALASGDTEQLLAAVRAGHRLKTAVPVRSTALIGGLIAGAPADQLAALADYSEAVGLAYQITDDVLDVTGITRRGCPGLLKQRGEDLRNAKVTMVIAYAAHLLGPAGTRQLWDRVTGTAGSAMDDADVTAVLDTLVACGAVEACTAEADRLVTDAWKPLDALLPDSYHKAMLRALGWYAARRSIMS